MTKKISLRIRYDEEIKDALGSQGISYSDYRILSRTLDARGAGRGIAPHYQLNLELAENRDDFWDEQLDHFFKMDLSKEQKEFPPIIIGSGPAGLFCALRLLEYGVKSILLERGDPANQRMVKISKYWRQGELDSDSNVCFGEGGAGLFSDGKLITRVKSPFISYVMKKFHHFGAPIDVTFMKDPHLGSNKIRKIISQITSYLKASGVEIRYRTKVESLLFNQDLKKIEGVVLANGEKIYSPHVVLATGHSATDFYLKLNEQKIAMKTKPFAIGVRIEHPRRLIDNIQYGDFAGNDKLGTAKYRLSYEDKKSGRGTYSFCMCPGGYILSSGTEEDGIVVNGMSNHSCNSPWSNSALVVSVNPQDFKDVGPLSAMYYQREIEKKAYQASQEKGSGRAVPAQRLADFLKGKTSQALPINSCPSDAVSYDLAKILPDFILSHLRNGLEQFDRQMKGYKYDDALLMAPETRTSAPVTVERDKETLESISHQGLFPCGEGAGYAGGITSAAVDGVKVAESIIKSFGHGP